MESAQPPPLASAVDGKPPRKGLVKTTFGGFFNFIQQYGIASLAIGVVIGTSVNDFVKSLVDGLISPLIGLLSPQQKLQTLQITVGPSVFKIGAVLSALLSLLIVFLLVYLLAKLLLRNEALLKKKD